MTKPLALRGLLPAYPTPVTADMRVDRAALIRLARYMLDRGAAGLVPLGGTGEFTAFTRAERIAAVEASAEAAAGKAPVVAGVLTPGLGDAIETGRDFKRAGADAIMLIVPYYARNTQATVADYFLRVREAADLPIVLYDNPARSHFVIQPETIGRMAEQGSIIGMKASNTDLYHFDHVMQAVGPDFAALSGYDTLFTQQVAMGARGGVLTSAVLVPAIWNEIQALAESDRFAEALKKQRSLIPLMDALFAEENPGPTRVALDYIGLPGGSSLPPIAPVSEGLKARLFTVLADLHQAGILDTKPQRGA